MLICFRVKDGLIHNNVWRNKLNNTYIFVRMIVKTWWIVKE